MIGKVVWRTSTRAPAVARNFHAPSHRFSKPLQLSFRRFSNFKEKPQQVKQVEEYVTDKGLIPADLVKQEIINFYENLGIDDLYFQSETVESIGEHIIGLYGAKVQAYIRNESEPEISLKRQTDTGAVFIHTSNPGEVHSKNYELIMDQKYLDVPEDKTPFRLESYLSSSSSSAKSSTKLRCYLIRQCEFVNPKPNAEQSRDINEVSDRNFLVRTTKDTQNLFQEIMTRVQDTNAPVIHTLDIANSNTKRLLIGFKRRSTTQFFSAISDVFHFHGLYTNRKFVDQFSNGVTICSFYLDNTAKNLNRPISKTMTAVMEEASLIFCLPNNELVPLVQNHSISITESAYANVGWIFAQHFIRKLGSEYAALAKIVNMEDNRHVEVLTNIKKKLRSDTFTRKYLLDIINTYPELIRVCYSHFASIHYTLPTNLKLYTEEEAIVAIKKTVQNRNEYKVFESFLTFNKSILKTNFYNPAKVALSFRLKPTFLNEIEFPRPVYGMFLVVGAGFRGFHIRFRDIARGGIRIVRSRNSETYSINARNLLDENYGLAATQQRKNKDIPEGGSKGTILLDANNQDKPRVCFEKYVDAILDLLVPNQKFKMVDLYQKEEILFFGPDEGTADMMDWASQHARARGASFWSAFTTGKSPSIGGIPHDKFGMTTRSVHQYVLGIFRKMGLDESSVTKLQIGGPDGDLGSNEIKISKDKTIGIVDGSGVLYDPYGIDRTELLRLVEQRATIVNFDKSKLSDKGFLVSIEDNNVTLPDGTVVPSGVDFRNQFHLNPLSSADVFVPCGGRPESVDLNNVSKLFNQDGTPRFKYIVEGANLFITQDARLKLEKSGVILFKDASANKGGVTSSSCEVLAALALTDDEFHEHMQVRKNHVPDFYDEYVKGVQRIIEKNAELEFEVLWKEWKETKKPISVLSDELSYAIVSLNEELQRTSLWNDLPLRRVVMEEAFVDELVKTVGVDTLMQRVPETYCKAIFGSYLASRFIYKFGINPSQFAFFEFMAPYFARIPKDQQ